MVGVNHCRPVWAEHCFLYSISPLHNVQLEYKLGTRVDITPGSKFDVKKVT